MGLSQVEMQLAKKTPCEMKYMSSRNKTAAKEIQIIPNRGGTALLDQGEEGVSLPQGSLQVLGIDMSKGYQDKNPGKSLCQGPKEGKKI